MTIKSLPAIVINTESLPAIEATYDDCEALADIIWFIKGRMSALADQGRSFELDGRHLEALRRFRASYSNMENLRHFAVAAESRAKTAEHFLACADLGKKGKKGVRK